jgi:hypothetical protein
MFKVETPENPGGGRMKNLYDVARSRSGGRAAVITSF